MNIYVTSEQIGLEGYWITDILAGISKEAVKKNITVVDYDGEVLTVNDEFTRPIVLVVGYSYKWMEQTCRRLLKEKAEPLLVTSGQDTYTSLIDTAGFVSFGIKKAIYNVVSYLITNKRSRIAFFGAHNDTYGDSVKINEFLRICKYLGLSSNDHDVYRDISLADCARTFNMNLGKYNAVICPNDAAALFLAKWLEDRNIRIPEDVFIVSFGNSEVARTAKPSITTVENNFFELGKQAVKLHQFLQKNSDTGCTTVTVDCKIIERRSTDSIKFTKAIPRKIFNSSIPLYDADMDVMAVLQAEELVRMWDDIDRQIIKGLLLGKTIVAIAEGLFISVSAVKYRIKKMLTAANLRNKDELAEIVRRYDIL